MKDMFMRVHTLVRAVCLNQNCYKCPLDNRGMCFAGQMSDKKNMQFYIDIEKQMIEEYGMKGYLRRIGDSSGYETMGKYPLLSYEVEI